MSLVFYLGECIVDRLSAKGYLVMDRDVLIFSFGVLKFFMRELNNLNQNGILLERVSVFKEELDFLETKISLILPT